MNERRIFSVSELNNYVKTFLEHEPVLQNVCVSGEISNYKLYPSGHHYFSLKDPDGSVSCVMFSGNARTLRFRPESGLTVIAVGRVSLYQRDGRFQIIVTSMMPAGAGDLQLAFEQLKSKLDREGLFDPSHKMPLPAFPKRIAVITSPVGAAVRDVIRILGSRWPLAEVLVVPVRVQGAEAPGEIRLAIEYVNRFSLADVIIAGRGGGSAEDLWAFNDENVARAIYASEIPVISAVGHEPDITIADYVADRRASTPSNGAEICVPDRAELSAALEGYAKRLCISEDRRILSGKKDLSRAESSRVLRDPMESLSLRRLDLDRTRESLIYSMERIPEGQRKKLGELASALNAMSPLGVLSRGYSVAVTEDGKAVRSVSELSAGQRLSLKLSDGIAKCTVDEAECV